MSTSNRTESVPPAADARRGDAALPDAYLAMLAEDGRHNVPGFLRGCEGLLRGVDLPRARVLEIGSGRGLMALLVGLRGAAHVVSMEPELAGASSGVIAQQRARVAQLNLTNVEVVNADFNTWQNDGEPFDVILSRASLNHLYPTDKHALHDRETYERYLEIARKIHGLLVPGGLFVATDANRYAFFTMARRFGIRRPWRWKRSGVDWRHHQNAGVWARIFRDAGFQQVTVRYPVPYRLRWLSRIVNTSVANFFLKGAFVLRARR